MKTIKFLFTQLICCFLFISSQAQVQIGDDITRSQNGGEYGQAVATSADGSIVAIGAYGYNVNSVMDAGLVQVFSITDTGWAQLGQDLSGVNIQDHFGRNVSLNAAGTILAVGASQENSLPGGFAEVYIFNGIEWVQLGQTLYPTTAPDYFGIDMELSEDGQTLIIGSGGDGAWVFEFNSTTQMWDQKGSYFPNPGLHSVGAGVSINNDGSIVVASSPNYWSTILGGTWQNPNGRIQVYQWNDTSSNWVQIGQSLHGQFSDRLGFTVDLNSSGKRLVAGVLPSQQNNEGKVMVYEFDTATSTWDTLGTPILGNSIDYNLGHHVSINNEGNIIVVGSERNYSFDPGRVTRYRLNGGIWKKDGSEIFANSAIHASGEKGSLHINQTGTMMINGDRGDKKARIFSYCEASPISVDQIGPTKARLNWSPVYGVSQYQIRGRRVGQGPFVTITVSGTDSSKVVFGLAYNAQYEWQIKAQCPGLNPLLAPWSAMDTFTTGCAVPDSTFTSSITSTSAQFNWTTMPGAVGYKIQGVKLGNTNVVNLGIGSGTVDFKQVFGLQSGTCYQWRIRTVCNDTPLVESAWSDWVVFCTPLANRLSNSETQQEQNDFDIQVFPNPSDGSFLIKNILKPSRIRVINMSGKVVDEIETVQEQSVALQLNHQPEGIYILEVENETSTSQKQIVILK